jgi:hypothetical protein
MRRSTSPLVLCAALSLALVACQSTDAGAPTVEVAASKESSDEAAPAALIAPTGGLVTLYAFDPEMHSISFVSGGGKGSTVQENQVYNHGAQMDYNEYWPEHFTVGISGREVGSILDLGPGRELGEQYGISETVGRSQAFASLRLKGGDVLIGGIRENDEERTLGNVEVLLPTSRDRNRAEAELGHVYLARIDDRGEERSCVVKFVVVDLDPGIQATIRWERLDV